MHDRKADSVRQRSAQFFIRAGFVLGLTLATYLACVFAPAPKAGGESGVDMDGLPILVGPLQSFHEDVTAAELLILPKDTTFARKTYGSAVSDRQDRILCSIILSGAERRSIHRPERCLPSQGWRIDSSHTETVSLASGRELKVTALYLKKHVMLSNGTPFTKHEYFLYWFVGKDVTTPSQTERILMTYWDALIHRVNQRWAYVIVAKDISQDWNPNGESPDQALTELKQFIHDSVPFFMKSEMPPEKTAQR